MAIRKEITKDNELYLWMNEEITVYNNKLRA